MIGTQLTNQGPLHDILFILCEKDVRQWNEIFLIKLLALSGSLILHNLQYLSIDSIGDTFQVFMQVLAIVFICSIELGSVGIGDTFSLIFWQYSIP